MGLRGQRPHLPPPPPTPLCSSVNLSVRGLPQPHPPHGRNHRHSHCPAPAPWQPGPAVLPDRLAWESWPFPASGACLGGRDPPPRSGQPTATGVAVRTPRGPAATGLR